jgi:ligand-binding sensor domain-containing protein
MISRIKLLLLAVCFFLVSCGGPLTPVPSPEAAIPGTPAAVTALSTTTPAPKPVAWPGLHAGWMTFHDEEPGFINNVIYDPDGSLWASSANGLYHWDIQTGALKSASRDGLPRPIYLLTLFNGKIWAASWQGKLAYFSDNHWTAQNANFGNIQRFFNLGDQLWLASDTGLYYLDGQDWKIFDSIPKTYPGWVTMMARSKDDSLWFSITTDRGDGNTVLRFNGQTWQSYPNLAGAEKVLKTSDGTLWFIYRELVTSINGQTVTPLVLPGNYYRYDILNSELTSDGELWLQTRQGSFMIQNEKIKPTAFIQFRNSPNHPDDVSDNVVGMSPQGWLLYGSKSVYIFTGERWNKYSLENNLDHSSIGQFTHDNVIGFSPDGNLWLRRYEHLIRFDGLKSEEIPINYDNCENCGGNADSISRVDSDGVVWFLGLNSQYLVLKKPTQEHVTSFNLHFEVSDFTFAADGSAWLALSDGFIAHFSADDPKYRNFVELDKIKVGGGLTSYLLKPSRIVVSQDGSVWVFVDNAGLYRYNGKDWKYYGLSQLTDRSKFTIGLDNQPWAGFDYNLFHYTGEKWESFSKNCIFPSQLTTASDGAVWFINGCDGVYRFDGQTWTHFSKDKELAGIIPTRILVAPDGALWFFSPDGWARFQP